MLIRKVLKTRKPHSIGKKAVQLGPTASQTILGIGPGKLRTNKVKIDKSIVKNEFRKLFRFGGIITEGPPYAP